MVSSINLYQTKLRCCDLFIYAKSLYMSHVITLRLVFTLTSADCALVE